MINIQINSKDVDNWIDREEARMRATKKANMIIVQEIAEKVDNKASRNNINVTNTLSNSISWKANQKGGEVSAVGYAEQAMETGTAPSDAPRPEALKRWARLRLGDENLAYPVAKKIAERGTRRFRKKGPKLLTEVKDWVKDKLLDKELKKLLDEYAK
jgi:hypothetical protein